MADEVRFGELDGRPVMVVFIGRSQFSITIQSEKVNAVLDNLEAARDFRALVESGKHDFSKPTKWKGKKNGQSQTARR